jgi:hypothetical protein
MACSHDGRHVVLGGADGVLRLLDTATGDLSVAWRPGRFITSVALSDDAKVGVACDGGGAVHLFEGIAGASLGDVRPVGGGNARPCVVGIDGAGRAALVAGTRGVTSGFLARYDLPSLAAHELPLRGMLFNAGRVLSVDGRRGCVGTGTSIAFLDVAQDRVDEVPGHAPSAVSALARSGTRVVTAVPQDGMTSIEVRAFGAPELAFPRVQIVGLVTALALLDDERTVVAGTMEHDLVFLELDERAPRVAVHSLLPMLDTVAGLAALEKDGVLVATRRGMLLRFDRRR